MLKLVDIKDYLVYNLLTVSVNLSSNTKERLKMSFIDGTMFLHEKGKKDAVL